MEDKKLEAFVDKLMANDIMEKPSQDFTNSLLDKLDIKSKTIVYKPLIPKWVWFVISTSFLAIVLYALFNHQGSSSKISEFLSFSQIEFKPLQNVDFSFSKTLIYAMVIFSIMIGLQVPLLKSYLNRRIQF